MKQIAITIVTSPGVDRFAVAAKITRLFRAENISVGLVDAEALEAVMEPLKVDETLRVLATAGVEVAIATKEGD